MKKKGFTPLDPESPIFQSGDGRNVKFKYIKKPRALARGLTGFTLIELIIVTALFSIIVIVIATVFLTVLKAWSSGRDRAEIRQEAVIAVESMSRDLSQASTITSAAADSITFIADVDNDGVNETVAFNCDAGNNLIRAVDGAAITLASNAQSLVFSYFDSSNNIIGPPFTPAKRNSIRIISIVLTMNKDGVIFKLSLSVYARNQIL